MSRTKTRLNGVTKHRKNNGSSNSARCKKILDEIKSRTKAQTKWIASHIKQNQSNKTQCLGRSLTKWVRLVLCIMKTRYANEAIFINMKIPPPTKNKNKTRQNKGNDQSTSTQVEWPCLAFQIILPCVKSYSYVRWLSRQWDAIEWLCVLYDPCIHNGWVSRFFPSCTGYFSFNK